MVTFVQAPQALVPARQVPVSARQRAIVHMSASLLLDYPAEDSFATRLDAVGAALVEPDRPPTAVAAPLEEFVRIARGRGTRTMAEHYVETFDRRRRCCLYLTYYAVGDTRHRGAALLAFKQALAAAGYKMKGRELPDYLPVVLELSARSGDEVADALLASHREGIEVLRSALADIDSPYRLLVDAVSMTLPRLDESTAQRVRALVAAGPPTETVGVTTTLPFPTAAPRLTGASPRGTAPPARRPDRPTTAAQEARP
ncbi:MAG: nitrate reductase molybdenum cofactor assembly chaperone [Actinomyces sp.]|uniref:nitrate reductase molybdenum cofactor assembly chaperone n=1 Tax=Actinomyces sp. TaxID=29317 RepID=UPI0026DB9977|nr:nitrate reductase molybdenum cofactor assembly chaperone [Actinomyces sp.]MDO4242295.1 nitrate reductase molybdenum cofactor assembly chaperone [Actinomyces sp.]